MSASGVLGKPEELGELGLLGLLFGFPPEPERGVRKPSLTDRGVRKPSLGGEGGGPGGSTLGTEGALEDLWPSEPLFPGPPCTL